MKEPKLREVVDSPDVGQYRKLPKRLKEKFAAFDKVHAVRAQPHVRLFRADWVDLDGKVREASGGKWNASTVRYRGLPLVYADE